MDHGARPFPDLSRIADVVRVGMGQQDIPHLVHRPPQRLQISFRHTGRSGNARIDHMNMPAYDKEQIDKALNIFGHTEINPQPVDTVSQLHGAGHGCSSG